MPAPIWPAPMTPTRSIDTFLLHTATGPAQHGWAGPALSTYPSRTPPNVHPVRKIGRYFAAVARTAPKGQWLKPTVPLRLRGQGPLNSVELTLFGRAGQSGRRRRRVDGGRDPVEVTGTDLALVLGRGVTTLLGRELALLQLDVGAHLVAGVAVGQVEHRVVQRVEAGQRDELELESH